MGWLTLVVDLTLKPQQKDKEETPTYFKVGINEDSIHFRTGLYENWTKGPLK